MRENLPKALILSDLRKGHENQSIAFCRLKGLDYEICAVSYSSKFLKILSYILDFFGLYFRIFKTQRLNFEDFDIFVGAGSSTYYPLKFLAKKTGKKSVALMYPKGYKKDFSLIIATPHDNPKNLENLLNLPVNLSFTEPANFYKPKKKAIGFIIGGNNDKFTMDSGILEQIQRIKEHFAGYEFLITTSARTPKFIEDELKKISFDFSVIYSQNQINPIGDFLEHCEFVFISIDSVSMISEAVSNLNAAVVVLELKRIGAKNKFDKFIEILETGGYLEIFRGEFDFKKSKKVDLKEMIKGINL